MKFCFFVKKNMKRLILLLIITVYCIIVSYSQKVIFALPYEIKNNEEILSIERAYNGPFVVALKVKTESYLGDKNQYCILTIDTTGKIKRSNNYDEIPIWILLSKNDIAFRGAIGNKWYSVEGNKINGPYDYEKDKIFFENQPGSYELLFSRNYNRLGKTTQMVYPYVKDDKFYVRKGEKTFGPYETHKDDQMLVSFSIKVSKTNKIGFNALINNQRYIVNENEVYGPYSYPHVTCFANDNTSLIYVEHWRNGRYFFGNKVNNLIRHFENYEFTMPGKSITYIGETNNGHYVYIDMEAVHGPYDDIKGRIIRIDDKNKVLFIGRIGKGNYAKYYLMIDKDKIGPFDEVTYVSQECKKNIIFITTDSEKKQTLHVGAKKFGPYDDINFYFNNFKDGIDLEKKQLSLFILIIGKNIYIMMEKLQDLMMQ